MRLTSLFVGFMFVSLSGMVAAQVAAPSRVEYVKSIAAADSRKLLGMGEGRLLLARKSGQVDVIDASTGQVLHSLQAQDGGGRKLLVQPESAALADGTVYVVDSDLARVMRFDMDGKFKGQFGGGRGSEASLSSPQGVAYAGGIVYVADTGNKRIQRFGDNGVFLGTVGIDAHPANKALDEQRTPYRLEKPTAVAVDEQGQLYVLDSAGGLFSDRSQVKIYAADGRNLQVLAKTGKPVGVQVSQGELLVADAEGYAIQRYDTQGRSTGFFGSRGEGRAQFQSLTGLAVEGGQVYVGDRDGAKVHQFRTGSAVAAAGSAPRAGGVSTVRWMQSLSLAANALAWDGKDTWVASPRDRDVLLRQQAGNASELPLKGLRPRALAFDKTGALWALDRSAAKLHKLDASGAPTLSVGQSGNRNGQFDDPEDFAFASDGTIYVADTGNGRVQGFSADGVVFKVITRSVKDKLTRPTAVAVGDKDQLFVLDSGRGMVTAYSSQGEPLREFGSEQARSDESLRDAVDLMATQDELFVLFPDKVRVYDYAGRLQRTFGAVGSGAGELAQAFALVPKDPNSFFVLEKGESRVQILATVYRPKPPEQLSASGAVHAIELKWAKSPYAYVQQYVVYRADSSEGSYRRVGTSKSNAYTDADLQPGASYTYRVASAGAEGQEGAATEGVSASAQKFAPPTVEEIKAEVGTSRVRLTWKAIESKWLAGYAVYQKEGDRYVKLADTATPEFVRDNLNAGSNFVYHVSARSVDGLESDKQAVTFATQADNRAPLEIDAAQLHNVFSNSYKVYEKEGVGTIKLTNNTRLAMNDVKVSFVLNNFMDFPTEQRVPLLEPGASREIPLRAVFNNNILTLTEDTPVQAKLEASYFENGQPRVYSQIKSLTIYDKHRMSWDERSRYAAFVTPKDPLIINFSRSVASEFGANKEPTQLAAALFSTLGALGVTYVQDPINPYQVTSNKVDYVDYIQYPRETLQRRSGDCDDLVALYTAALESLGIPTRVLLVPGHMLLMFSTGVDAPSDGYTMDGMYVAYQGTLWIPVEATLVGKSFVKAWETGAATFYREQGKEGFSIFDVHEAWDSFKPASLPDDPWRAPAVTRDVIERHFPGDFLSVLKISSQTLTRRYLQAIQRNPTDWESHLQVGIILARQGDRAEARKYFRKIADAQPRNAAALNNLGNLAMLDTQYTDAQKLYADASKADPKDPEILVNLALAYKATKNADKAKEAFGQAQKVDPAISTKYKALGLELMNALSGGKPSGASPAKHEKK